MKRLQPGFAKISVIIFICIFSVLIISVVSFFFIGRVGDKTIVKNRTQQFDNSSQEIKSHHFSTSQFNHTVSFDYPNGYSIHEGGRPFNMNDEGTTYEVSANCNIKEKCAKQNQNIFTITLYENRKNWTLDEWMTQSIYSPQHNCQEKDPEAKVTKSLYKEKPSYSFISVTDTTKSSGCLDTPGEFIGKAEDIFLKENQMIYQMTKFSNISGLDSDLNQMSTTVVVSHN